MRFSSRLGAALVLLLVVVPSAGARWSAPSAVGSLRVALFANGSFEGTLAGWGGYNATLALASDGVVGPGAARVIDKGSGSYSIYPSPVPVQTTVAGSVYTASSWVRSATAGRTLCLRVRERSSGSVVASAQSCKVATTAWAELPPVAYTARGSDRQLDVYVYATSGTRGESFEIDGVSLDLGSDPPPPPAPAPLAPPAGLTVGSVGPTSLVLAWTPSSDPRVVSYQASNGATVIGMTPIAQLAIAGLVCGTSYDFSLRGLDSGGAGSAAATVSAATSACPVAPSNQPWLYAPDSPLNTLIPSAAPTDPGSPAMVQMMENEIARKGWPISVKAYTDTVYYADASTPRYDIPLAHYGGRILSGVPIPNGAAASAGSDGGMVVIDEQTSCEYDLGRAAKTPDGTWSAFFANTLSTAGSGIYPFAEAPSASGFASLAGRILPEEMQAGAIPHALLFAMQDTKAGGPVWPATGSDGWSSAAGAIPEGARVQLDPTLNLDDPALGLNAWQKTIARALQRYGMYLVDTGGTVALGAQHAASTSIVYPWGDVTYAYMPPELAHHMRVLKLGAQQPVIYRWVDTPCATLR